jgi:aquaporin Z
VSELTGTAVLLLIIQLASTTGHAVNAALTIGIGLAAVVYAGGPISGAHYNPAITLAVFLRGKITAHEVGLLIFQNILLGFPIILT